MLQILGSLGFPSLLFQSSITSSVRAVASAAAQLSTLSTDRTFGDACSCSSSATRSFRTSAPSATEMRFPVPKAVKDGINTRKPRAPRIPPPKLAPLERIDPFSVAQQSQLTLHGGHRLSADPGAAARWSAPYYLPEALQKGIPRALLCDPWPDAREAPLRRQHAELLVRRLRASTAGMTAQQLFDTVNAEAAAAAATAGEASGSGAAAVFGSLVYVRRLLEHLRTSRMLRGANNPKELGLGPGSRDYPLIYHANKYQQVGVVRKQSASQLVYATSCCSVVFTLVCLTTLYPQEEYGPSWILDKRRQEAREAAVAQALKRLRRRKPPYPIHRRLAHDSALHHELGQMELAKLREAQRG